jgi:hypothetical protein
MEQALRMAEADDDGGSSEPMKMRLKLYQQKQPFHESRSEAAP